MFIFIKNLILQTIDSRKYRGQASSTFVFFWSILWILPAIRQKKGSIQIVCRLTLCNVLLPHTWTATTISQRWNIGGTLERCRKENQYIHAVLVLATNRRCEVYAAYIFLLAKANKSGCFSLFKASSFRS